MASLLKTATPAISVRSFPADNTVDEDLYTTIHGACALVICITTAIAVEYAAETRPEINIAMTYVSAGSPGFRCSED